MDDTETVELEDTEVEGKSSKKDDVEDRKKDYASDPGVKNQLDEIYAAIVRGFDDKTDQNIVIDHAWDIYNCVLNDSQKYRGTSKIYVPLVRDAIEARVTRFSNQIFPQNGRYAEVVGEGSEIPYDIMALLNYYVKETKLRSVVIPALLREGDCSGQYTVALDWSDKKRHIVKKIKKPETVPEVGEAPEEETTYDDVEYEEISDSRPDVMVVDARNLCVLPATVDCIEDADIVALAMWVTKERVKALRDNGTFNKKMADDLLGNFGSAGTTTPTQPDTEKKAINQAGVKADSKGSTRALIYKAWARLKIKGETRLMEIYFGGENNVLSCKRCPFWIDKVPVLSYPALKVPGSFWGKSPVEAVEQVQYQANDAVNIGMDSAQFALLPIVMTDPEKNPKVGSMILAMAAIWETNPTDTQFAQFPPLYKDALSIVAVCKEQIQQSMSVSPSMMPSGSGSKKPSQAEVAQEQQVALGSTANVVNLMEEGILSELLEWFYAMDYQYRDKEITLQKFGQMGLNATLEQIPIIQIGAHYTFSWNGTEANKSVQEVQQMIAAMNVLRGIPPEQLNGRKLDITPILEHMVSVAFGPRMGPKVLIDERDQMSMPPEQENALMLNSFPVHTNPMDNDQKHIEIHQLAAPSDLNGFVHSHIAEHIMQMQAKARAAMGQLPPPGDKGEPGVPGGAGPGVAGTPRMGAQPGIPRMQQPPGAVGRDEMPLSMPRKAM